MSESSVCAAVSLDEIEAWIDAGLYLRVHPHIENLLSEHGVRAACLAMRALRFLGEDRRGDLIGLRLGRRHRGNADAVNALIRTRIYRHGPYAGWLAFARYPLPDDASIAAKADYLSLRGFLMALFRDFDVARNLSEQARTLKPEDPWLWVEWAYCCERADQYDESPASLMNESPPVH
ncbi:MAG: hypothetical protein CGU28_08540 [Candidatus Dactylopiibacterium carminicum]|uniref:Uncharacterized protein n=1 Tax=Candidatus Dactylopiibacterium carminicum TaxID=857335 RepID=A0A272ERY9_9RHOO|nr:hypothetical protein [Candidatus Dactylopiibacterium carminicum]KAF7598907.1 hypothetical protein BGI27_10565 [Candidatus Dactylopiibacterium carminicum]PAS92883.1 MAG: hypothetical protein CGU29_09650 [Candidatus Dactylopiibacterium carminicum]PAS96461.1 MAG: hypothetical protein CGU28_08540 [Candidatus Dactylopiibacterium carminicum]PAS98925.1 MAG: hypothetical protein BSR46_10585 [Candidatus Dactylopiibacterium carminicum]